MKHDSTLLNQVGEEFGIKVAQAINRNAIHTVTITEIDEDFALAEVYEGDGSIRVPLAMLNVGTAILRITPTVGSIAAVVNLDGSYASPYFVAFTSVDKVEFVRSKTALTLTIDPDDDTKDQLDARVGDSSVRVTSDVIEFNGGENDGLVLSQKAVDKLNAIERDINTLKTAFATWRPVPNDGGSALSGLTGSWAAQRLTETVLSDIVNDKITQ